MNHKLSLRDWLAERRDNARSLAASPMRSSDSAGWQEDASYFQRAIDAVAACEASAGARPSDKKYLPAASLPVSAPAGVRMLNDREVRKLMNACVGQSPRDLPAAIQRRFAEVNGLKLATTKEN